MGTGGVKDFQLYAILTIKFKMKLPVTFFAAEMLCNGKSPVTGTDIFVLYELILW
jgi:hypothetical protein